MRYIIRTGMSSSRETDLALAACVCAPVSTTRNPKACIGPVMVSAFNNISGPSPIPEHNQDCDRFLDIITRAVDKAVRERSDMDPAATSEETLEGVKALQTGKQKRRIWNLSSGIKRVWVGIQRWTR
ncbi:MAG: hypothetical protein M1819_003205 [Sarea resinae]|nr:MAG: hypothetical protein M1819_003205 [Sarea resinae]